MLLTYCIYLHLAGRPGGAREVQSPPHFKAHIGFVIDNLFQMGHPSSIWYRDSNSRPLEHESPAVTTRLGPPPVDNLNRVGIQSR